MKKINEKEVMFLFVIFATIFFLLNFASSAENQNCNDDQILFRLFSETNSHVSSWNDTDAPIKICYNKIFNKPYPGQNPHDCNSQTNSANKVLLVSAPKNAHAEDPNAQTPAYENKICYGDLNCRVVDNSKGEVCNNAEEEQEIIRMSGLTNAHVSIATSEDYNYILCCKRYSYSIYYAIWQNSNNVVINSTFMGTSVNLIAGTDFPSNSVVKYTVFKDTNSNSVFDSEDLVIDTFNGQINGGVAKASWTIPNNLDNATSITFEVNITTNDGKQSKKQTSETLTVYKPGIGYTCVQDQNQAIKSVIYGGSETQSEIINTVNDSNACKGPDGEAQTGDDCCAPGYICNYNGYKGCYFVGFAECGDYKTEDMCNNDPADVPKKYNGVLSTDMTNCENYIINSVCRWNNNNGKCEEAQETISGTSLTIKGYCLIVSTNEGECINGVKKVTVQTEKTGINGENECLDTNCVDKEIEIPCGRPTFALNFFGFGHFVAALIVIELIYTLLVRFENKKKK